MPPQKRVTGCQSKQDPTVEKKCSECEFRCRSIGCDDGRERDDMRLIS